MADRIGFIGLGIMGKPMVRNLVKAGYDVVVHNRSQAAVDELTAESDKVTAGGSPAGVAAAASVVITMLPDSPDVRDVVFGPNGLAESMQSGSLLIDMSTIAPATSIEVHDALAERGVGALDAPVSGGDKGAIAGTLSIMVGGSQTDFDRAHPYFEAMGKTIVLVGGPGAGQTVKACNQIVVALNYAAVSEALVMGAKAGVDPAKIIEVLSGGLAASRVLEMRGPTMVSHQFAPGFRVNLHRKDLGIAMATAKENGVPLPVTALVSQLYDTLAATGSGDLDHSALVTVVEKLAGYSIAE
jgi:2-hydroxy-3-oxopropionate reductase